MTDDQKLIEWLRAECALRHPDLGSVVLSVPDARRLLALARRGLEAEKVREHARDLLELARWVEAEIGWHEAYDSAEPIPKLIDVKTDWCNPRVVGLDEIESALTPKEPSDA